MIKTKTKKNEYISIGIDEIWDLAAKDDNFWIDDWVEFYEFIDEPQYINAFEFRISKKHLIIDFHYKKISDYSVEKIVELIFKLNEMFRWTTCCGSEITYNGSDVISYEIDRPNNNKKGV